MCKEMQKKEIETIKGRTVTLELSDADTKSIRELAASVGLTVGKLLENFIGDLIEGTYSNGSDERHLAQEWFERCGFGMFPEQSFLRYLLGEGELNVETILNYYEEMTFCQQEIADTNTEISTGTYELNGTTHYWYELVDSDGKQCYTTFEDWKKDQLGYIDQNKVEAAWYKEEIESCWRGFLEWTDQPADSFNLQEEMNKLNDWKIKSELELTVQQEKVG